MENKAGVVYLKILYQQKRTETQKHFENFLCRNLRNTKQGVYCDLCKTVIVFFSKQFHEIVQNGP
jgi:hypothetical protein